MNDDHALSASIRLVFIEEQYWRKSNGDPKFLELVFNNFDYARKLTKMVSIKDIRSWLLINANNLLNYINGLSGQDFIKDWEDPSLSVEDWCQILRILGRNRAKYAAKKTNNKQIIPFISMIFPPNFSNFEYHTAYGKFDVKTHKEELEKLKYELQQNEKNTRVLSTIDSRIAQFDKAVNEKNGIIEMVKFQEL